MKSQSKTILIVSALALLLFLSPVSSSAAEQIIKEFEGLRLNAYRDAGSYAIGYGSQWNYDHGRPVISTDTIDAPTALKWLKMRNNENRVLLDSALRVPVNTNQRDALLSFIYNIGSVAFLNSTLLKKLNAGRPKTEVAAEFDKWVNSQGTVNQDLVKRRAAEKKLFLS